MPGAAHLAAADHRKPNDPLVVAGENARDNLGSDARAEAEDDALPKGLDCEHCARAGHADVPSSQRTHADVREIRALRRTLSDRD
eukprot:2559230-Prymnesium_polylepis.2